MQVGRILLLAIFLASPAYATAAEQGRTKEFPKYKCKLTLPGPDFEWITGSSELLASFRDASGTMVLLLKVDKDTQGVIMNESHARSFDNGVLQSGVASKISGQMGRFKGLPCYQLHVRYEAEGAIGTARVFAANGYVYSLQIIASDLPVSQRGRLEPIFSAFEFIGRPVPNTAKSSPTKSVKSSKNSAKPKSPEAQSYEFSKKMGVIARYCIIGAIVLGIGGWIVRKMRKGHA